MLLTQSDTLQGIIINRKNNLADHIRLVKVVKFQTFLPSRETSKTARNSFENKKSPFDLQSALLRLNYLVGLNKKKKNGILSSSDPVAHTTAEQAFTRQCHYHY